MLTHRNLVANMCQNTFERPPEEWADDRGIAVLPFFHSYGLVWLLNLPVYCGATVVTMPRFDLREFLRVIQDYRITIAYVVPPIVLALVKHPLVDEFDLSSLDLVGCGAAPLSAELEVACGKRLGCRIAQGYGLTETSPTTHRVTYDLLGQMPGEVGPLVPNTECRIVDVATGEDAPTGEPGELLIRGPQVMKGYLNNPASDRAGDRSGRLASHRRRRSDRGERLAADRRPDQGADQIQGLPDRARRTGGAPLDPPGDHRRGGDPAPRRGSRRGTEGVRGDQRVDHT